MRLNLEENQIEVLPPEIFRCASLEVLNLSKNPLREFPDYGVESLTVLRELKFSENKLTSLPPLIFNLTSLEYLDLSGNQIGSLPNELSKLVRLRYIDISGNRLTEIPDIVWGLPNLEYVDISSNQIGRLSPRLHIKLKILRANDNHLIDLTSGIGRLEGLRELYLNNNNLHQLPRELSELKNLKILELKGNLLTVLPAELGALTDLEKLVLHEDQLTPVPLTAAVKKWDVFISHASEDKDSVAVPLAGSLKRAGLRVWLDSQELRIGDSLREKIEQGLAESRFGIVIISEWFLEKRWPKQELNGLFSLEDSGSKVILPVWHNITKHRISQYAPILADRIAANTQDGISSVAADIVDAVLYRADDSPSTLFPNLTRQLVLLVGRDYPSPALTDFLSVHEGILGSVLGHGGRVLPLHGEEEPTILFSRVEGSIARRFTISIVLSFSSGPLFGSDGRPTAQLEDTITRCTNRPPSFSPKHLITTALKSKRNINFYDFNPLIPTSHRKTIIVAGRRHSLSVATKSLLASLNQELEDRKLEVRSYDWLIDACTHMAQFHHRGN